MFLVTENLEGEKCGLISHFPLARLMSDLGIDYCDSGASN